MYDCKMHNVKFFYNKNYLNNEQPSKHTLFLDRDGVLIKEKNYISDPSKVELEIGASELLLNAYQMEINVVIVTNQSGISRGFFNWDTYDLITKKLLQLIGPKNPIIGIFANGYGPLDHKQDWRKPNPGMLKEAAKRLNIDLENSFLIGDRLTDLKAGYQANLKGLVHVMTGHGSKERGIILNNMKGDRFYLASNLSGIKTLLINNLKELDEDFFRRLTH